MGYHSEGTGQVSWGITVRAQDRAGVMGYHSEGTGQVSWGITSEGTGQVSWGITVRAQDRAGVMGYVRAQDRCHGVSPLEHKAGVMGYHSDGVSQ